MPMYKPSELMLFLESLGINPKKALSQNFLIDGNVIRKIIEIASVKEGDRVLEVGPGPGSLTEALLNQKAQVTAVEKDHVLALHLERFNQGFLKVVEQDILEFPLEQYFGNVGDQKVKVIANLPYHLTTPILVYLVQELRYFSSLTLMVQEEVARRFTARPGSKEYSSFTVFLNFYSDPVYSFKVKKNCFYPAPTVDSAIVHLKLKKPPAIDKPEKFFEMTRQAFEHRRKMLRSSLRELYQPDVVMNALKEIGCDPLSRPEQLSLDHFLSLYKILSKNPL